MVLCPTEVVPPEAPGVFQLAALIKPLAEIHGLGSGGPCSTESRALAWGVGGLAGPDPVAREHLG